VRPLSFERPALFAQSGFAVDMSAYGFVGEAPAVLRLCDQVCRAARNHRYVMIRGEAGTGKELGRPGHSPRQCAEGQDFSWDQLCLHS
jgi:transcriptional regulator with GAF, ATPase, and Fis domain